MHRRAIEQVAPPSILVDESHRLVHLSEQCRPFSPAVGRAAQRRCRRPGAAGTAVRAALGAESRLRAGSMPTLSLPDSGAFQRRAASRSSAGQAGAGRDRHRSPARDRHVHRRRGRRRKSGVSAEHQASDETVRRLTQELELMQARLRTVREESDTANEELRAANEELQSINEEYRSTSGGAGNQQGGTAVDQRGAADRQRRAETEARRDLARA